MKKAAPVVESATSVQEAHRKFENARRNLAAKKALFLKAEDENSRTWSEFCAAKDKHETAVRELR